MDRLGLVGHWNLDLAYLVDRLDPAHQRNLEDHPRRLGRLGRLDLVDPCRLGRRSCRPSLEHQLDLAHRSCLGSLGYLACRRYRSSQPYLGSRLDRCCLEHRCNQKNP